MLNMNWSFEKVGEAYFRNKITEKTGVCFVAVINNEIIGYMAGGMAKIYSYRKIKKQTSFFPVLFILKDKKPRNKTIKLFFMVFYNSRLTDKT